jgi:sugar O-acyltransferase (sialic acid O-acetyltransferase NeuD family)
MIDKLVLIGGGGHCKACIDVIETTSYAIAGILDPLVGEKILNYEVLGDDTKLTELSAKGFQFLITVGQIQSSSVRKEIFTRIKDLGGRMATILAETAVVSKHSRIGEGTIIMHQAVVNAAASIGNNCIINNKALIEHDAVIGDHVHVSTGAIVNGGCKIGDGVFLGSNSVLAQGIEVGSGVVIGAGTVVIKNILEPGIYAGNPAKKLNS